MVIKTKSIFQPAEEEDGLRILITRFYPRGVKKDHFDLWMQQLAPSIDLLMNYKNGKVTSDKFISIFLYELFHNIDSYEAIHNLHHYADGHNITLLCYEKGHHFCHRHLVRDVVEEPERLISKFISKETYHHEGCQVSGLIPNQ